MKRNDARDHQKSFERDQFHSVPERKKVNRISLRKFDSGQGISQKWSRHLLSSSRARAAHWFHRRNDEPACLRELQQATAYVRWKATPVSWQLSGVRYHATAACRCE